MNTGPLQSKDYFTNGPPSVSAFAFEAQITKRWQSLRHWPGETALPEVKTYPATAAVWNPSLSRKPTVHTLCHVKGCQKCPPLMTLVSCVAFNGQKVILNFVNRPCVVCLTSALFFPSLVSPISTVMARNFSSQHVD